MVSEMYFLFIHCSKYSGNKSKIKVYIVTGRYISILLYKNLFACFHLWK